MPELCLVVCAWCPRLRADGEVEGHRQLVVAFCGPIAGEEPFRMHEDHAVRTGRLGVVLADERLAVLLQTKQFDPTGLLAVCCSSFECRFREHNLLGLSLDVVVGRVEPPVVLKKIVGVHDPFDHTSCGAEGSGEDAEDVQSNDEKGACDDNREAVAHDVSAGLTGIREVIRHGILRVSGFIVVSKTTKSSRVHKTIFIAVCQYYI